MQTAPAYAEFRVIPMESAVAALIENHH